MVIEFIGCSGAGKTTLFAAVQQRLAQTTAVTSSAEFVTGKLGLQGITRPSIQNLIQELIGLPFFLISFARHWALVNFVGRMLARHPRFTWITVNNLRSLVRKIGVHELIRRDSHVWMVLVDEGMLLLAHNIFVFTNAEYSAQEIAQFATLIPAPDGIVYVRAPLNSLVARASARPDRRREMRDKDQTQIEFYMRRAVAMFEQLVDTEEMRDRVLVVDNPEGSGKAFDQVVEQIAEFVLSHAAPANVGLGREMLDLDKEVQQSSVEAVELPGTL